MPFLLHRPDSEEPSTLTENDVRRVMRRDFPDPEVQNTVWSKLAKGQKIFIPAGKLEWVSDATV
jgi:hypothetical protein